jgi:hypothetical protein
MAGQAVAFPEDKTAPIAKRDPSLNDAPAF